MIQNFNHMKKNYRTPDMEDYSVFGAMPLCTSGEIDGSATIDNVTEEDWNIFSNQ